MHKNELELEKLKISAENITKFFSYLKHATTLSAAVGSIYLIMQGLAQIAGHNPESLNALAKVVEKLEVSYILAYVLAAGTSAGWLYERIGKQRAYKQLGQKRHADEKDDPYHPSSELNDDGQTPS